MIVFKRLIVIPISMLILLVPVSAQEFNARLNPEKKIYTPGKNFQERDVSKERESMADYNVIDYQINLHLFPDSEELKACVQIKLVPLISIENALVFDFAGLQLDSVFIKSEKVVFKRVGEILTLFTPSVMMVNDTQTVALYYQGQPQKGLYFRTNGYNETVIYSHNEPYDAHYWFPCKDEPADKASASILITVPAPIRVLSNGILIGESNAGPGFTLYSWREDYPIATYLISIAAAPYQLASDQFSWNGKTLPLQYWLYPADLNRGLIALEKTKEMLALYSEFIGDYPFQLDKYAMSEVPLREAAAMENQTATTMGDFVMDNEGIIAHELAHQWWGDALTPLTFKDIWLNEGFASYFDALYTEYKYGQDAYNNQMIALQNNMSTDGSLVYPIYNPPGQFLFGNAVYNKGAWVLHMLRQETGDSVFKQICQSYFRTHQYKNVITADFIQVTENITGRSFASFFDQWLNYGGLPILIGDWSQDRDFVTIGIEQFQENPTYQFNLDVLIEAASKDTLIQLPIFEKNTSQILKFSDTVIRVTLDPEKKLLTNNNTPLFYIPTAARIIKIYPNPFQQQISIEYQIEQPQDVELLIYDILGQRVAVLVREKQKTGVYRVNWNGEKVGSGIYYCLLKTGDIREVKKLMLIK